MACTYCQSNFNIWRKHKTVRTRKQLAPTRFGVGDAPWVSRFGQREIGFPVPRLNSFRARNRHIEIARFRPRAEHADERHKGGSLPCLGAG
jgi:hypothetical protein